mgnify:CR=1 FL=1
MENVNDTIFHKPTRSGDLLYTLTNSNCHARPFSKIIIHWLTLIMTFPIIVTLF